jgi:TonB-dependent starch-binding outer membrane protein SusC
MHRSLRIAAGLLLLQLPALAVARAQAPTRVITGKVTDAESGQGLPSVAVIIKGTLLGTHTTDDGSYSLPTSPGVLTLSFRRIGYIQVDRPVKADERGIDIALKHDVLKLTETIVTGQATGVTRQNAANAVGTVSSEEISHVQAQTMEQQLQGKVAGADIQANSGAPGGGMQVRLRGTTTVIGASDPLYVVDGVIISNAASGSGANSVTKASGSSGLSSDEDNASNRLADLDPNDIETIEVLKGASASAIYGSKASNGVVIISTKRGHAGKPQLKLGQRFGTSAISHELGSRLFPDSASVVSQYGVAALSSFKPGVTYNHEDELAGHKPLSYQSTASVGGGTDATQYYASGIIEHDGGIIANTFFDKQALNLNLHQTIGPKIDIGLGSSFSHTGDGRGLTNNDNTTTSFYTALPATPSFANLQQNSAGQWPNNPFAPSNPLQTAALLTNAEAINRFIGSGSATAHLVNTGHNSLNFILNGGVDYFTQVNSLYSPPSLQYEIVYGNPGTSVLGNTTNEFANVSGSLVHVYTPASGSFTATSSAGVQEETRYLNLSRALAKNLSPGLSNIDRGTISNVEQLRQNTVDKGLFAQEEFLTLHERLLLTVGGRADQSSNNSQPTHLFFYPKGSVSYRLASGIGFIDNVKLRAAIGESGNEPLYGQKFGELLAANITGLPTQQIAGAVGNPSLRPERQLETEAGFDITMFNSKATLGVTGYQKNISDLLLQRALAPSAGIDTEFFNAGSLRTRGLEIEASVAPIQERHTQWSVSLNFSKDASVVTSLPVPPFSPGGFPAEFGAFEIQQGKSPTQIIGNVLQGNGSEAIQTIGDANPDFHIGLSNTLAYHHAHLYFLFNWVKGGDDINLTQLLYDLGGTSADFAKVVTVRDSAQRLGPYRINNWLQNTVQYVQDASFIKLREVTLSFDLPDKFVSFLGRGVQSASLSVEGRNLITWTHYQGLDPEVSNFGNQAIARNVDVAPFPPSRTFWVGLNLGF